MKDRDPEYKRLIKSFRFPMFFLLLLWIIKLIEFAFGLELYRFGIYPLELEGIIGIFFSPLIHGSFKHLLANSGPIFFLTAGLIYFYRRVAFQVFVLGYILVGVFVWLAGRSSFHVGASGLIYCFASFMFFSGIIKRNTPLMAVSLLIAFLYGGMLWGIFPLKESVSWESHLMGFVVGIFLAWNFKNQGPGSPEKVDKNHSDDTFMEFHNRDATINKANIIYHEKDNEDV